MAKQIIERELAKFDVCFAERAERAAASRVPIDSLGWIIRVNAFVRLSVCINKRARADNCFFVPAIETIFMKRERESFQQVISGCEMFTISPLSLLVRQFYIHEQCLVSIIADV